MLPHPCANLAAARCPSYLGDLSRSGRRFLALATCLLATAPALAADAPAAAAGAGDGVPEWWTSLPPASPEWSAWLAASGEAPPDFATLPRRPDIPDPLLTDAGAPVRTVDAWPARRAEILGHFSHYVTGRMPPPPGNVRVAGTTTRAEAGATSRTILLEFGPEHRATLGLELLLPAGDGPFPVFLTQHNHRRWALIALSRGYAAAVYAGADARDDTDAWPAIWPEYDWTRLTRRAWAAARVIDHLETLPQIDRARIAITGHSRNGKVAIIAGAFDARIGAVISSSAGAGGASSYRFNSEAEFAEGIELLTRRFPDWMHPRLRFFAGREDRLPIDQPNLIAALAPRPFLYSSALNDNVESVWDIERSHASARRAYDLHGAGDAIALLYRDGTHLTQSADIEAYLDWLDFQFGRAAHNPASAPICPTFADWQANSGEHIDPAAWPAGGIDDLLTAADGSVIRDRAAWQAKAAAIRARIAWGLGEAPPTAVSQPGAYGAGDVYQPHMLRRAAVPEDIGSIALNFGNYIQASLFYPQAAVARGERLPVIIWVHPISTAHGYRAAYRRGLEFHLALARQGYAVLAFDRIGHGTRQLEATRFYHRYPRWSLLGKDVEDIRQAVNALTLPPDSATDGFGDIRFIDPARIYLLGYAAGGRSALHAAALDERIAGVVAIAGYTPMRLDTAARGTGGLARFSQWHPLQPRLAAFIGAEARVPYDYHEVLAAIAPRPAIIVTPARDTQASPDDVAASVAAAAAVYRLLGAADQLTFALVSDYNRLGPEMQERVFALLPAL
jgi:dienelactone hydrolase